MQPGFSSLCKSAETTTFSVMAGLVLSDFGFAEVAETIHVFLAEML